MPKAKKETPALSNEQLALSGFDFFNKKAAIKELEAQCKEIRKPLEDAVLLSGHTTDKGSKILVIPHADKEVHLKETLRVGVTLLPEAIDVLKKNGLDECIESIEVVREDVLERLHSSGKVSDEILKQVYAEKTSYAFSVDVKERFDV